MQLLDLRAQSFNGERRRLNEELHAVRMTVQRRTKEAIKRCTVPQNVSYIVPQRDRTASATSVQPGTRIISARPFQARFSYSYVAVGNISTYTERRAVPLRYLSFLLKSTRRKNPAVDRS